MESLEILSLLVNTLPFISQLVQIIHLKLIINAAGTLGRLIQRQRLWSLFLLGWKRAIRAGAMYWIDVLLRWGGRLWFEDLDRVVLLNLLTLHFIVVCNNGWADARNLLEGPLGNE